MADLNSIGGLHYEMMRRCYNEKAVAYKDYGAKGIRVCEEWHDRENFRKWCKDNGYVKGLRINRLDSGKDYCPENCFLGSAYKKDEKSGAQKQKAYHKERMNKKLNAGITGEFSKDELYKKFKSMHSRCEMKSHPSYPNYGGRGITVCEEWSGKDGFFNFYKWAHENGWKSGLTIDRKENNIGYNPQNCKFSTRKEQTYNRRSNIYYEYSGISMPLGMIAKLEDVKYGLLYSRVKLKGMSIYQALADIKNDGK